MWIEPLGWINCKETVKTINGRLPVNSSYVGGLYPASNFPVSIRGKYLHGVPFNHAGFADFSRYSIKSVTITLGNSWNADFKLAAKVAGYGPSNPRPVNDTWHHHENTGYMQLISTDIHNAVKHTGGIAVSKKI